MPARRYKCEKCQIELYIVTDSITSYYCKCGELLSIQPLSGTAPVRITERANAYLDKHVQVGVKEMMQERSREHMRDHEIHDIVAKFGVKNLQNHPLIKDGRVRRKGE